MKCSGGEEEMTAEGEPRRARPWYKSRKVIELIGGCFRVLDSLFVTKRNYNRQRRHQYSFLTSKKFTPGNLFHIILSSVISY